MEAERHGLNSTNKKSNKITDKSTRTLVLASEYAH